MPALASDVLLPEEDPGDAEVLRRQLLPHIRDLRTLGDLSDATAHKIMRLWAQADPTGFTVLHTLTTRTRSEFMQLPAPLRDDLRLVIAGLHAHGVIAADAVASSKVAARTVFQQAIIKAAARTPAQRLPAYLRAGALLKRYREQNTAKQHKKLLRRLRGRVPARCRHSK